MLLFLFLFPVLTGQNFQIEWGLNLNYGGEAVLHSIATGSNNHLFLTGSFSKKPSSGLFKRNRETRTFFFSSVDSSGNQVFEHLILPSTWISSPIVLENRDQIILLISFRDSIKMGDNWCTTTEKYATMISQFSLDGSLVATDLIHTGNPVYILDAISDESGGLLIAGYFRQDLSIAGKIYKSEGGEDAILARYTPDRTIHWIKTGGSKGDDRFSSIERSNKSIYISATFEDQFAGLDTVLVSHGRDDIFYSALDSLGNVEWLEHFGGRSNDIAHDIITIDGYGHFIIGTFQSSLQLMDTVLTGIRGTNTFLSFFDSNRKLIGLKVVSGGSQVPNALAVDMGGEKIFIALPFKGSLSIDQSIIKSTGRNHDLLVMEIVSDSIMWIDQYGSFNEEYLHHITIDKNKDLYLAGEFFQKTLIGNNIHYAKGIRDILLIKFYDPCSRFEYFLPEIKHLCAGGIDSLDAGADYMFYSWDNGKHHDQFFAIDKPGTYYIQVTDSFGCIREDSIEVIIDSISYTAEITHELFPYGSNGSIVLTADGGIPPYSYAWGNGESSPVLNNLSAGIYSFSIHDKPGCTVAGEIEIVSEMSMDIHVDPNPFFSLTEVSYRITEECHVNLSLYNEQGVLKMLLFEGFEIPGEYTYSLERNVLPAGIYFIQLSAGQNTITKKLVIVNQ